MAYTADEKYISTQSTYIHQFDVAKIPFPPSSKSRAKHENFMNATGLVKLPPSKSYITYHSLFMTSADNYGHLKRPSTNFDSFSYMAG